GKRRPSARMAVACWFWWARRCSSTPSASFSSPTSPAAKKPKPDALVPRLPCGRARSNFGRRKRWKPWADSPAAWRMTSTMCCPLGRNRIPPDAERLVVLGPSRLALERSPAYRICASAARARTAVPWPREEKDHATRMIVRVRGAVESPEDRSHRHEENHDKVLERLSIGDCAARNR